MTIVLPIGTLTIIASLRPRAIIASIIITPLRALATRVRTPALGAGPTPIGTLAIVLPIGTLTIIASLRPRARIALIRPRALIAPGLPLVGTRTVVATLEAWAFVTVETLLWRAWTA